MLNTVRAVVREGKIALLEPVDLPEGTTVLVTPLIEADSSVLLTGGPTTQENRMRPVKVFEI